MLILLCVKKFVLFDWKWLKKWRWKQRLVMKKNCYETKTKNWQLTQYAMCTWLVLYAWYLTFYKIACSIFLHSHNSIFLHQEFCIWYLILLTLISCLLLIRSLFSFLSVSFYFRQEVANWIWRSMRDWLRARSLRAHVVMPRFFVDPKSSAALPLPSPPLGI